jgi:SAM-dependent methyltransferase
MLRDAWPTSVDAGGRSQIDQWYSDGFLARQAGLSGYVGGDLGGRVLEITAPGAAIARLDDRVGRRGNVGDVTRTDLAAVLASSSAGGAFDAAVCPLALQYAPNLEAATVALAQCVRPGGVVLATLPGIGPRHARDPEWPERWHVTPLAARRVFEHAFPPQTVTVQAFGNVLTATAHLYGLPATALRRRERELHDTDFPVVVAVRAVSSPRH